LVTAEGCTPAVAASGQEACALLEQHSSRIALVLLDLVMPRGSGFAFRAAALSDRRFSHIPTAVISGARVSDSERALLRADAWLTKPFRLDEVRRIIRLYSFDPAAVPVLGMTTGRDAARLTL
jgi:CheY-like chemotaxis protein